MKEQMLVLPDKLTMNGVELIRVEEAPTVGIKELIDRGTYTPDDPNVQRVYLHFCDVNLGVADKTCPQCESSTQVSRDGYVDTFKLVTDVPYNGAPVVLYIRQPRYVCYKCGKKFSQKFDFVESGRTISKRLETYIFNNACNSSFARVASTTGVTTPTVKNIFMPKAKQMYEERTLEAPRVLGLDEKTIQSKKRLVVTDIENRQLLDLYPDNEQKTVRKAILSLKNCDNIEFVTTDMYGGYGPVIKEVLPNAKQVVDKFHVIKDVITHVGKAKTKLVARCLKQVETADYYDDDKREELIRLLKEFSSDTYILKFSPAELRQKDLESMMSDTKKTKQRVALLARVCEEFSVINDLRNMRYGIYDVYNRKTVDAAAERMDEWLGSIEAHERDPAFRSMQTLRGTMIKFRNEILMYFESEGQTNAVTEAINSIIDRIDQSGAGHSFETLKYKALLFEPATKRRRIIREKLRLKDVPFRDVTDPHSMKYSIPGISKYTSEAVEEYLEGCGADIDVLASYFAQNEP